MTFVNNVYAVYPTPISISVSVYIGLFRRSLSRNQQFKKKNLLLVYRIYDWSTKSIRWHYSEIRYLSTCYFVRKYGFQFRIFIKDGMLLYYTFISFLEQARQLLIILDLVKHHDIMDNGYALLQNYYKTIWKTSSSIVKLINVKKKPCIIHKDICNISHIIVMNYYYFLYRKVAKY